jgi:hypothetical protein
LVGVRKTNGVNVGIVNSVAVGVAVCCASAVNATEVATCLCDSIVCATAVLTCNFVFKVGVF